MKTDHAFALAILLLALLAGCVLAFDQPVESGTAVYSIQAVWQYGPTVYAVKIRDGDRVCYVPASGSGIACFEEAEWAP